MSQSPAIPMPRDCREFNTLGLAGFICSLVGLFTGGILSPVGLIISLFALGKHPRGFAAAGLVLGILGSGCLGMLFTGVFVSVLAALGLAAVVSVSAMEPRLDAAHELNDLSTAVHAYYDDHKALPEHLGLLVPEYYHPAQEPGRDLLTDPWHKPYRYEISPEPMRQLAFRLLPKRLIDRVIAGRLGLRKA